MKTSLVLIASLLASPAYAEKKWTHLPDGRWMFVDPNGSTKPDNMCDFQGTCYKNEPGSGAPQANAPPTISHSDLPVVTPQITGKLSHAYGTGCGNWPLGSDADLDCRSESLLPTAQVVWRLDPNNRWVQIDPNCGGRWDLAPTGNHDWQWTCPGDDWRRDPRGKWQVVPKEYDQ